MALIAKVNKIIFVSIVLINLLIDTSVLKQSYQDSIRSDCL